MMPPQLQPRQAACVSRLIGHDHARPDTHLAPQLDQSAVVKASQIDRSDPFSQDDDVEKLRCIVSPPLRRPFCGAQIPIAIGRQRGKQGSQAEVTGTKRLSYT